MTVGFWVLFGILALAGIVIALIILADDSPIGGLIVLLITIIVLGGLRWFGSWYYNNTASRRSCRERSAVGLESRRRTHDSGH